MKKSEQLSLDEGFYEFKDTNVLNRISKRNDFGVIKLYERTIERKFINERKAMGF